MPSNCQGLSAFATNIRIFPLKIQELKFDNGNILINFDPLYYDNFIFSNNN